MNDDPLQSGTTDAPDIDPQETAEWRDALQAALATHGPQRVAQLLDALADVARDPAIGWQPRRGTPYVLSLIHI